MIRFERRLEVKLWVRLCVPLGSLFAAFVIVTLLLFVSGVGAWSTYSAMISVSITSSSGLSATFVIATPIILTGLCATMAFRMGIYNIGGEGQLYMGAMAATAVALALRGEPGYIIIIAMTVVAALAGCVWSLIPGLLRAYFSTNEILVSLMLNYIAGYFISYLIFDSRSYWRDLSSAAGQISQSARRFRRLASGRPPRWAPSGCRSASCWPSCWRWRARYACDGPPSGSRSA